VQETETIIGISARGWIQCKGLKEMEVEMSKYRKDKMMFTGGIDSWVLECWKILAYVPTRFLPCDESAMAVNPKGEMAYVCELGKRLVQISFEW
jgi:hypothetical protein